MNLTNKLLILFALTGISSADTICQTKECKQTADLILDSIDDGYDPCDDFYEYSCGNWIRNHPLTLANQVAGSSHFVELQNRMTLDLEHILLGSSTSTDPKYIHPLINFYKGCVNSVMRDINEANDFKQIRSLLDRVGGWPLIDDDWDEDKYDVEQAFIELNKLVVTKVIIGVQVINDIRNNSQRIVSITNAVAPQRIIDGIYPKAEEYDYREGVKDYDSDYYAENPFLLMAELLKGRTINANKFSRDMMAMQNMIMKTSSIPTPINTFNHIMANYDKYKMKAKDLSQYSGLNYRKIIDGILKAEGTQLSDDELVFVDKDYLKGLGHILDVAGKRAIANTIGLNLANILSRFSSSRLLTLSGIPSVQLLPQVCINFASQIVPDLLGRHYMDRIFAKDSIEDMKDFIASLKEAFNELLEENKWMDSTTKANAIKKLKAITEHIAFPDYTFNDTQLLEYHKQFANISETTFLSTMIVGMKHLRSVNTKMLRTPMPVGHWPGAANGIIINAFYNPMFNGIFFPAGIAQFPFYQHTRPKSLNLGAIGMVISHELTHAFDNKGSLFDEKGNLHNWFGNESRNIFNEKAKCFVDQYNQFSYSTPTITVSLNGQQTLGENIADNGGVRIAYRALELYKSKNAGKISRLPGPLSSYSEEQLFFLSFANLWCSNRPASAITRQIAMDPHPIENARVIASLSNFPEFAKAFKCEAGSRMNPRHKCVLWG